MFRAVLLLVLSLASSATANSGPPPWHSHQSWQAVFEFPADDGVKWTLICEMRPGGGTGYWRPTASDGKRTFTLTSPDDFRRHEVRPPGALTLEGVSTNGETRTLDVRLPSSVAHHLAVRAITFVRYRVEWGADGIEVTLLEEGREYGPVMMVYILGAVSVVYAVGLWLFVRRRNRLTRIAPPPGN